MMRKVFIVLVTVVMMMGLIACNKETDSNANVGEILNGIQTVKMDEVVDGVSLISLEEAEVSDNDVLQIKSFLSEYGKEKRYICTYYGGENVTDTAIEKVNQYLEYLTEQGYEEISSPFVGNVTTCAKGKEDIVTIELIVSKKEETSEEECVLVVEYYK